MNKLIAVFAFLVLFAFLAILVIHVPRLDLTVVILVASGLGCWDLYTSCFAKKTDKS
ncbi:hypothetical protein [Celeribacter marinus]|uniref:Uncharacterized protein n=1 Tax=Celeribacter marinus TaxID=1397108 RepID=A0A0P0A7N5_9RHOB|nr:hypothetical protein [Celeribacter marinus]ALI54338.1 hypothetical protein IMCC12053_389 [Celeribacter marinus]SFK35837.1 hypothetical protein SAMN05444421_103185 [Celeribacter marinus]